MICKSQKMSTISELNIELNQLKLRILELENDNTMLRKKVHKMLPVYKEYMTKHFSKKLMQIRTIWNESKLRHSKVFE